MGWWIVLGIDCGVNSLAPGRFEQNFRWVIFKLISVTDVWGVSCKIALRWMPLDLTDEKSTLVQVMAWCRQAARLYQSQCWPRFMSPYGVTRAQWVIRPFELSLETSPIQRKVITTSDTSAINCIIYCLANHRLAVFRRCDLIDVTLFYHRYFRVGLTKSARPVMTLL